uniref:Iqcf4 protein n=1 Tax=Mus musculus TaxID=10090 RepID=Q0P5Z0_MOUSE|nr:Iqcf4 protein [Mus musculus]
MGCLYSKGNVHFSIDDEIYDIKETRKQQQKEKEKEEEEKKLRPSSTPKVEHTWPSKLELSLQHLSQKTQNARKIQAWWRGTLVRRSLLRAALSAWIIQSWWRKILAKRQEKNRLIILHLMAQETRACVLIQSWVRMLKIRQNYCRLCYATRVIQASWRWYNCRTRGFFPGQL